MGATRWGRAAVVMALAATAGSSGCASEAAAGLRIVQSDRPESSGMEGLLSGSLVADDRGCIAVRAADGSRTSAVLVWPRGYTIRGTAQAFEILDAANVVVARSGAALRIGGGGVGAIPEAWTGRECADGGEPWMVGHISAA